MDGVDSAGLRVQSAAAVHAASAQIQGMGGRVACVGLCRLARVKYDVSHSCMLPHNVSQVYGFGKSEEFLGEFMKATGTSPIIATKYAPQPWRLTQGSVPAACKASLERLQLQQMGLYIQHW